MAINSPFGTNSIFDPSFEWLGDGKDKSKSLSIVYHSLEAEIPSNASSFEYTYLRFKVSSKNLLTTNASIELIPNNENKAVKTWAERLPTNWNINIVKNGDKWIKIKVYKYQLTAPNVAFDAKITCDGISTSTGMFWIAGGGNKTGTCFCNRNFTEKEVKNLIIGLRDSEKATKNDYALFTKSSNIPKEDKTLVKFTECLNTIFSKFNINSCIRKAHFLAQAYLETNRFRSSKEEGVESYLQGKKYYPYYGRGLMQLTWEGEKGSGHIGYKQYFDFLGIGDYKINYTKVDSNINLAFDSAGWCWEKSKIVSKKTGIWKSPHFLGNVGIAVAKENASEKITTVKFGEVNTEYGVIDLNLLADHDWIDTISWLINGGGNGFDERRNYLKKIKELLNYENCVNHK